jgi:hypothetical protein
MAPIDYRRLRRLLADNAQLVEVLPADEYTEMHLPGAVNIPLKTLTAATTSGLARNQAVHGTEAGSPRIGQYLRQDVVTARPDDLIGDIRERVGRSAHRFALVTTADGVLLGRLRSSALEQSDPAVSASRRAVRVHRPIYRSAGSADGGFCAGRAGSS